MVRIDPQSYAVVATFTVDQPFGVAAEGNDVWVTSKANDQVKRINATTRSTTRTLTLADGVPNGPTTIVVGKGGVWVASDLDPYVSRIDPVTNKVVDRLTVGGVAGGMAVDRDGNVWVVVHAQ